MCGSESSRCYGSTGRSAYQSRDATNQDLPNRGNLGTWGDYSYKLEYTCEDPVDIPDHIKNLCSPFQPNGSGALTCTGNDGVRYTYGSDCD